jgi:hypothetical protein
MTYAMDNSRDMMVSTGMMVLQYLKDQKQQAK